MRRENSMIVMKKLSPLVWSPEEALKGNPEWMTGPSFPESTKLVNRDDPSKDSTTKSKLSSASVMMNLNC